MRIKYFFVSFFLWAVLIVTEKASAQQPFLSWDRLTLRKTFQSTLSLSDPASFTFVAPKGEKSSYSINAALGYDIAWDEVSEHLECNITLEYHRDNQLKREQNVLQSGIAYDWTPLSLLNDGWSPIISGKVDFKRDAIDSSDLLQAAIIFTPIFTGHAKDPHYAWVPGIVSDFGFAETRYAPYVGIESENPFKSNSIVQQDQRLLFFSRLQFTVLPASHCLNGNVELGLGIEYRRDLLTRTNGSAKDHRLFQASADIIVFKVKDTNRCASIGLDYTNGEDPSLGFSDQEFLKIAFKIKL